MSLGLLTVACGPGAAEAGPQGTADETEAVPEEGLVVLNPTDPRPYFHSFGDVEYGREVRHTFQLQNRESVPLEIFNVQGGCACTRIISVDHVDEEGNLVTKGKPRSPQEVLTVPPMGRIDFTVSMDTSKLRTPNMEKLEVVRMRTSSTLTTFPTFELNLKTLQPFQITPPTLNLGEIPQNGGKAGVVRIVTKDYGGEARILGVAEQEDGLIVSVDETVTNGEFLWAVSVQAEAVQPMGAFRKSFTLSATDPQGEGDVGRHRVEVWGQVVPDIVPAPRTFSFQPLDKGESFVLRGSLRALIPGAHIKILGHRMESEVADALLVEYEPKAPNDEGASTEWSLHITALAELPEGRFSGKLHLETDDPQNPTVIVPVSGTIR